MKALCRGVSFGTQDLCLLNVFVGVTEFLGLITFQQLWSLLYIELRLYLHLNRYRRSEKHISFSVYLDFFFFSSSLIEASIRFLKQSQELNLLCIVVLPVQQLGKVSCEKYFASVSYFPMEN